MNARKTCRIAAGLAVLWVLASAPVSAEEMPLPGAAAGGEEGAPAGLRDEEAAPSPAGETLPPKTAAGGEGGALVDSPREGAAPSEGRTRRELAPGESVLIDPSTLEEEVVFEIVSGESSVALRVTPDGFLQIVEVKARVAVAAANEAGNRVSFGLIAGEKVSIWPLGQIRVSAATGEFSLDAQASDWAFVVRADEVRPGGLPFRCDDVPGTLQAGERLDSDREAGKIIFRKIGREWPGKPVLVQVPKAPPRPPAPAEERRRDGGPMPPGVIADRGRDFPWQTIPLPVIAWEIFRPPDVSP